MYTYAAHKHSVSAKWMKISSARWTVVAHDFSPSTQEAEAGRSHEIDDNLVYKESARPA